MSTEGKIANQEYMRVLNPFDPTMWGFHMYYPIQEEEFENVEKPEYDIDTDFLEKHGMELDGLANDSLSTLRPLLDAFSRIAKSIISYRVVGYDKEFWKYLVSMHTAHNMEMAIARLKNQADEMSMSPEKPKEKKIEYKIEYPKYELQRFQQTKYGFAFWTAYEPFLKFRFFGVYTNEGLK